MIWRITSATAVGLASLALAPGAVAQAQTTTQDPLAPEYAAATPAPTPAPTVSPTPTPTPPPSGEEPVGEVGAPPEDAPKRVRRVYRDFRRDALIEPCDHTMNTLRDTRDTVPVEFEEEFPDFLESVKAAIRERKELDCKALAAEEAAKQEAAKQKAAEEKAAKDNADDPGAGAGGGGAPAPTPAPTVDPLPIDPLPAEPGSIEDEIAPDPLPPIETPAPLPEEAAPAPVAPAAPVPTPAPAAVSREPAAAPAPVFGLAASGGLLALGGLVAPLLGARGGSRIAAFQHSWAEAGFRVRGIWQDFRDWLRIGR